MHTYIHAYVYFMYTYIHTFTHIRAHKKPTNKQTNKQTNVIGTNTRSSRTTQESLKERTYALLGTKGPRASQRPPEPTYAGELCEEPQTIAPHRMPDQKAPAARYACKVLVCVCVLCV